MDAQTVSYETGTDTIGVFAGNTVVLSNEVPLCPLVGSSDYCDVPFLRNMFPEEMRTHCSGGCGKKCIVREASKMRNLSTRASMVGTYLCNKVRNQPMPVDEMREIINEYCRTRAS
jgi:hypothetical protein